MIILFLIGLNYYHIIVVIDKNFGEYPPNSYETSKRKQKNIS